MEKLYEIRMTFIILLVGLFFVSGCFFEKKYEVTFKTNGGTKIENVVLKSGATLKDIKEPTKDGYKFKGWYLDNKEFDLNTKIDKDIVLVAKWEKVEIDYEDNKDEDLDINIDKVEEEEEEVTTKKVKTTTKKKETSKKKTTTKKNTTTSVIVIDTTTKKTTQTTTQVTTTSEPVTVETTTTTSTTTTNAINVTTIPTSALITTTVPTTEVVRMNIVKVNDQVTEVNPETLEEETKIVENITITFDVEEELSNVESNISVEDYELLKNSDRKLWIVNNEYGIVYENMYDLNIDSINSFTLRGNESKVYALSIFDGLNNYVFEYDELLNKWFIKYPGVSLGQGLSLKYYKDIDTALKLALEGDTITVLANLEINNSVLIDKFINIDFNNKEITCNADNLLEFNNLNDATKSVIISNFNGVVNNFMLINNNTLLDKILINDSNITYNNVFKNNDVDVSVSLVNTSLSGIL